MASSSKALGKTTGCVQKTKVLHNKGRKMSGTKQNQKRVSLLSKVTRVLLSSQTLAANTLHRQKFFLSDTSCLSCLLLQFSHGAKDYQEEWFFNYNVTTKRITARAMTELQRVFSTSSELTGMFQSWTNKSYLQNEILMLPAAALALLENPGHHTSSDMYWILQEITEQVGDF